MLTGSLSTSSNRTKKNQLKLDLMKQEIRRRLALDLPLTAAQHRLVCELQRLHKLKPRERYVFDGENMHIVKTNQVDAVFDLVKQNREIFGEALQDNMKYIGSLDEITAARFAKESGLKIGTKEYARYVKRKLQSSDYAKFSGRG